MEADSEDNPHEDVRALSLVLLIFTVSLNAEQLWMKDWHEALKKASSDKKDVLVFFNGVRWCKWSAKLKKEVLDHKEFTDLVKDKYILLDYEYSVDSEESRPKYELRKKISEKYNIQSFPQLMLMDSNSAPYAVCGYEKEGLSFYKSFLLRSEKLATSKKSLEEELKSLEGISKAEKYADLLKLFYRFNKFYSAYEKKLRALDPQDNLGYFSWKGVNVKIGLLQGECIGLVRNGKSQIALQKVDDFIEANKLKGIQLQNSLYVKLICYEFSRKNFKTVDSLLTEIISIEPESDTALQCKKIKKNIAAGLKLSQSLK